MTRRGLVGMGLVGCVGVSAEAAVPDIRQYIWRSRVLLLFAPRADDPALLLQRSLLAQAGAGMAERDLVAVDVVGDSGAAAALRERFGVAQDRFCAVLVGKDGGATLSSAEPIPAERLFAVIDAMPMRREEAGRS